MINNLKWNRKKNIPTRNVILAFGVAGGLQSAYRKYSKQKNRTCPMQNSQMKSKKSFGFLFHGSITMAPRHALGDPRGMGREGV